MRELTLGEIEYVSGGGDQDVTVTGHRPVHEPSVADDPVFFSYLMNYNNTYGIMQAGWYDIADSQAFQPGKLPNGYSAFGQDGKFMRDANNKVYLTPAYASYLKDQQAHGWNIDWYGVVLDLAKISGAAFLGTYAVSVLEGAVAMGLIGADTLADLKKSIGN